MNSVNITANKFFLFGAAPAFDLMLPLKSLLIRFGDYAPNEFYRTTTICIRFGMRTCLVFLNTAIQVSCEACVVGSIGAFEDVESIWHIDYLGYSRFVYATHPSGS